MEKTVHYIFNTYKRNQILVGITAEDLENIFKKICKEKGLKLICQSVLVDHVHLLIAQKKSDRNEYIMKIIKGGSSREIFKKYPDTNRFIFRKLWERGYRADIIENEEHFKRVLAYIQGQKIKGVDKRIGIAGNRDV